MSVSGLFEALRFNKKLLLKMYNMQDAGVQLFLEGQSLFDLARKKIVMKKKQSKKFEELDGLILTRSSLKK